MQQMPQNCALCAFPLAMVDPKSLNFKGWQNRFTDLVYSNRRIFS